MPKHKRVITLIMAVLVCAILIISVGFVASRLNRVERALRSGRAQIDIVKEIEGAFPGVEHSIAYYDGRNGDPIWRSRVGLHGRYILECQIPITLNEGHTVIMSSGSPSVIVTEIVSIECDQDGRMNVGRNGPYPISADALDRCISANGDIKALLGPHANTTPVAGFKEHYGKL